MPCLISIRKNFSVDGLKLSAISQSVKLYQNAFQLITKREPMEIFTSKIITQIECKIFDIFYLLRIINLVHFIYRNNVQRIVSGKIIQTAKNGVGKITVGYESFPLNYNASLGL